MKHLWLAVTAHGFGHLAQVAPVVNELRRRRPGLRLTVQTDLPAEYLAERLPPGFRQVRSAPDPGMPMNGPLRTLWREALDRYRDFLADVPQRLDRQSGLFEADPPDLVLADVPWLPLAAARRAGIPAVGLSSLNWLDILRESPVGDALPADLVRHMAEAYRDADLFIRPEPGQPMPWLERLRRVGPIAQLGSRRGDELRSRLGLPGETRLALLHFGGVPLGTVVESWPRFEGVHWLAARTPDAGRADFSAIDPLGWPFVDLVASCDLLVTKPGYGAFAEAACHGLPVLYVPRGDWPEEPWLTAWVDAHVPAARLDYDRFLAGTFGTVLRQLAAAGRPPPLSPTGAAESADLVESLVRIG